MPTNTAAIRDLLFPGLYAITGKYPQIENRWGGMFNRRKSNMGLERSAAMAYLGLARLKNEGSATSFDNNAGELFVYNQEHIEVALGYAITRKAIDDNLYKSQFRPSNIGLMESFTQYKEITGAAIFNTGTTAITGIGGDGKALFATDHPIQSGATFANKPAVEQDLNEASLLNGVISVRQNFVDNRGLKIRARVRKLCVPSNLEPVAIRLTKTEMRPGTGDNDVNAILFTAGGIKEGYMVNEYFTSNYAWFLLTDKPGLNYMERVAFETDMQVDFVTDNLLVKGYERYSFGYDDPRAAWATFPTS